MAVRISEIDPGSPAQRCGFRVGDLLCTIGGKPVNDMLDYEYYTSQGELRMTAERDGSPFAVLVKKAPYEPFGCGFDTYLIDRHHACCNRCIFCFVDQLPQGMRESLYFKDDDERLSFLYGNYITLTNLSRREMDRIKDLHISPINISVHATDPDLRTGMMRNRFAGDILPRMRELAAAGIEMNCQIVLCRGINDGSALDRSMRDLCSLWPQVRSVAVVPIGLTRYRKGLPRLLPYDAASAWNVLSQITAFGDRMLRLRGERIVLPADEWYFLSKTPLPPAGFYGEYLQLDNGVGMCRKFYDEFMAEISCSHRIRLPCECDMVTGEAVYPMMLKLRGALQEKVPFARLHIHAVRNRFFGGNVSVTGLLTGTDILAQLGNKKLSQTLLLPSCVLRSEGDLLLDGLSPEQIGKSLHVRIRVVPQDGAALARAALGLFSGDRVFDENRMGEQHV